MGYDIVHGPEIVPIFQAEAIQKMAEGVFRRTGKLRQILQGAGRKILEALQFLLDFRGLLSNLSLGGIRVFGESTRAHIIVPQISQFFFALTGVLPMFNGGRFMELGKLPFPAASEAELHADGILMVEIGVMICVAGVIITILEVVLERTDFDD